MSEFLFTFSHLQLESDKRIYNRINLTLQRDLINYLATFTFNTVLKNTNNNVGP